MGKKLVRKEIKDDNAAIGIGVLIVFIAMVLVAGIAASVLVQTSTTLEMQALKTGSQTVDQVASGIMIEGIEGFNSSGSVIRLALELKPRAGSPDIDLSTTVVEISDSETKYVLEYDSATFTLSNDTNGDIFSSSYYPTGTGTGDALNKFGVIVLQDADDSCTSGNPVINFGDHVILSIGDAFAGISPRTDVFGQVIAEEGSPGIIGFRTPESYTEDVLELQ
jgi:archaeal flagellin FlaB